LLNVIMLNVVMLSIVILNVVAPFVVLLKSDIYVLQIGLCGQFVEPLHWT
jgi:hypothetical protein